MSSGYIIPLKSVPCLPSCLIMWYYYSSLRVRSSVQPSHSVMSDSLQPHRHQASLSITGVQGWTHYHPLFSQEWLSNISIGGAKSLKSCPTLHPVDYGPSSSLHGILQARTSWSGLLCLFPGDLPDPGTELLSPWGSCVAGRFFTTEPPGKPSCNTSPLRPHL